MLGDSIKTVGGIPEGLPPVLLEIQRMTLEKPRDLTHASAIGKQKTFSRESLEYIFLEDAQRLINNPSLISIIPNILDTMSYVLKAKNMEESKHKELFTKALEELTKKLKK